MLATHKDPAQVDHLVAYVVTATAQAALAAAGIGWTVEVKVVDTERMARNRLVRAALLGAAVLFLAACAAGPNNVATVDAPHIAGFWLGVWHGLISPITFLVSLFNHHVNIYEVHNNGGWYNFGFMLGVSTSFSGGARSGAVASRRRTAKVRERRRSE